MWGETRSIQLTAAVDLAAEQDLAVYMAAHSGYAWAFVHNTGPTVAYWRETADTPAAGDTGHPLEPGAAIVALVVQDSPFWLWSPSPGAELTVSPGAPMPTRGD